MIMLQRGIFVGCFYSPPTPEKGFMREIKPGLISHLT